MSVNVISYKEVGKAVVTTRAYCGPYFFSIMSVLSAALSATILKTKWIMPQRFSAGDDGLATDYLDVFDCLVLQAALTATTCVD